MLEKTKVNSFYVILSGLFKFDVSKISKQALFDTYQPWQTRVNGGDYEATFNYLSTTYYDAYLSNIFPEIHNEKYNQKDLNPEFLNHLTNSKVAEQSLSFELRINAEKVVLCNMDFIDLYLFPFGLGLFSIKVMLNSADLNLGDISDLTNRMRQLQSVIKLEGVEQTISSFVEAEILKPLNLENDWYGYNPQLKSYIMIDLADSISEQEMNYLLYDIGNVSPLGSAKGDGVLSPSEYYFNEQMQNNKLSVFKNWSAIALFDTFTRISINHDDLFKSWEYDFFQIYIHTLHIKFFMYLTNTRVSDVTSITKETEEIRDDFIEFVNDYNQSHISYKFLPDLIQDKLLNALEIESEVNMMETKIARINEHAQEIREKRMNLVLLVITFLGVFSMIYDVSSWFVDMGVDRSIVYPRLSIVVVLTVLVLITVTFRVFKK